MKCFLAHPGLPDPFVIQTGRSSHHKSCRFCFQKTERISIMPWQERNMPTFIVPLLTFGLRKKPQCLSYAFFSLLLLVAVSAFERTMGRVLVWLEI